MPSFTTINSVNEIPLHEHWVDSTKFKSKDRVVDANGLAVSSDYQGHKYRIIAKKERVFPALELVGRGFLGTLIIICTLCFALFSKFVRDLFKKKESIRYGILIPASKNSSSPRPPPGNC